MSYRVGTRNYNLPLTEGTDKRDWSDTNRAFEDIDAAIYQAGTDASQALTLATTAQTTADEASTNAASAVSAANAATAQASAASEMASLARTEAQSAATTAGQAQTTAQAAQTTATNADTVALAAQTNIGTMANLQTTDKSSLVAAINEVLSQIGGGGMPELDYGTPLYTFSDSNLSFTASKKCYLVGEVRLGVTASQSCSIEININGKQYGYVNKLSSTSVDAGGGSAINVDIKPLIAGDIVTLTKTGSGDVYYSLHVLDVIS